jgi:hypothetical protein
LEGFLGCVGGFERHHGGMTDGGTQSAHFRFVIRPNIRCKSALFRRMSLMKQISVAFSNDPAEVPRSVVPSLLRTEII